jgi:hypothetical protein
MKCSPVRTIEVLFLYASAIVLALCSFGANEVQDTKPPKRIEAEVFFKARQQTGFKLSPDGTYLAFIGSVKGHNSIFLRQLDHVSDLLLADTGSDINTFLWGTDDFILYLQDKDGDENFKLFRVDIRSGEKICLTNYDKVRANLLTGSADSEGNILISMNLRDPKLFDPYRLNIRNGDL